MDAGPGEVFEVDWRDIVGIDGQRFETTEAGDVGGSSNGQPINQKGSDE